MILPVIIASAFALHNGDKVLFYGDSITEQRLYTTYVETFVRTRYPNLKVDFVTAGVGGDATWGGWLGDPQTRVSRDVKPEHPTRITIMLGMNDGGYVAYDPKIEATFVEWYHKLLGLMHDAAPNAKITMIKTSPFDDFTKKSPDFSGYNATLLKFGEQVKSIAAEQHAEFVSFNEPVSEMLQAAAAKEPQAAQGIVPDFIHPSPPGHLVMAGALLRSWGAGPLVSLVHLDSQAKAIVEAQQTTVSAFNGMSWTQDDECLPFPVDESTAIGAKYSDFYEALNQETLKVSGLPAGNYELDIDGKKVGVFTHEALANGLNLASMQTPMHEQAASVLDLATKRNEVHFDAWERMKLIMSDFKRTGEVVKALLHLEEEVDQREREASQPKPHHYQLKKV